MAGLLANEPAHSRGQVAWRRLGRNYVATYVVEILTLVSGLTLFHLVAVRTGPDGFSYYQVARGVISTLQPVVAIGLIIALQRYLPRAGAGAGRLGRQAFLVQMALVLVVGAVGWAAAKQVGAMLAIPGGAGPVRSIFVALAGLCLLTLTVAALWGTGHVAGANVTTLVGIGAVPLIALQLIGRLDLFLVVQGAIMAALAALGLVLVTRSSRWAAPEKGAHDTPRLAGVVAYGVRRVPGDVALPAMYAFPTFFVSSAVRGGAEAGYMGFATSAVMLVCSVFATLTPVLLPLLSARLSGAAVDRRTWRRLRALPVVAVGLAGAAVASLILLAPMIVRFYLGPQFAEAVGILRLGLLPAVALAAFYAARPVLDALQDHPITIKLLVGCLTLQVGTTYAVAKVLPPTSAAITGMAVGAATLGTLSYLAIVRVTRVESRRIIEGVEAR